MKITFAGKFESALIRSIDEVLTPDRNASIHEYYAALNRNVTSNYFDRCGTFLALADLTLVPTVDWNYPYDAKYRGALSEVDLGVIHSPTGGNEWDDAVVKFAELILKRHVLSASSTSYISNLTLAHYTQEKGDHVRANIKRYGKAAARHYLCRLFLQLKSGRESGAYVILSEEDTVILQEVGRWAARVKPPIPFEIPDLKGRLIEPESFASGLLNFSPPDIRAVGAVRSDKQIRVYAEKIATILEESPSEDRERKMLGAMVEAHRKSEAGRRAEKVFEIVSWLAKPLHYVPGLDAALSVAEDLMDVGDKFLQRDISDKEWHLIAVRMTDIALRDYFNRKSNMLPS